MTEMQEVKVLGEELLREPVKRVNHVSKLLKFFVAGPSQVLPSPHPRGYIASRKRSMPMSLTHAGVRQECTAVLEAFLFSFLRARQPNRADCKGKFDEAIPSGQHYVQTSTSACRLLTPRHHKRNSGHGSGKNTRCCVGTS